MSQNLLSQELGIMQKLRESLSTFLEIPTSDITPEATISDLGIDSLMTHEVSRELSKRFNLVLSARELMDLEDMGSLCKRLAKSGNKSRAAICTFCTASSSCIESQCCSCSSSSPNSPGMEPSSIIDEFAPSLLTTPLATDTGVFETAAQCMTASRENYDDVVEKSGLSRYFADVYPVQKQLVLAYTVEAFKELGCDLSSIAPGATIPLLPIDTKHTKVVKQYYALLKEARLIERHRSDWVRTSTTLEIPSSSKLLEDLIDRFPRYASEHRLSFITGSRLASCLTGECDAVDLLLKNADSRALLEDYYVNSPYLQAGTAFLSRYLVDVITQSKLQRPLRILEIGAGTCGTTTRLIKELVSTGLKFEYTFSDTSPFLTNLARKKFAQYDFMQYKCIDIEQPPPMELESQFDVIISANCVNTTTSIVKSTRHIKEMLNKNGVLCLLEQMQPLPWFDIVFGLLEDWWRFEDGRKYTIVHEGYWDQCVSSAGFRWIDWSRGTSQESNLLRLIVASPSSKRSPTYSLELSADLEPLPS